MQPENIENSIAKTIQVLASAGPVLKGSVSKVTLGKKTRSRGDRVAYLLTYKGEANITRSLYIRKDQLAEVKQMIRNYRKLKLAFGRLLDLNVKLFKARQIRPKNQSPAHRKSK